LRFSNERGAALIVVLLIITLISIFSVTLLFQLTTAKKQFNQTEGDIQAINTAEMGIIYMRQEILSIVDELPNDTEDIENQITNLLPNLPVIREFNAAKINPTNYEVGVDINEKDNSSITIEIISSGTVQSNTKTLTDIITLSYKGRSPNFDEDAPSDEELNDYIKVEGKQEAKYGDDKNLEGNYYFTEQLHVTNNSNSVTVDGDLYLEDGAQVNNNGNLLYVTGNLYSESTDFKGGTKSKIVVEHDAIFKVTDFETKVPICIKGSTNYDNPIQVEDCTQAIGKNVYVTGENGGEWVISSSGN